MYGKFIFWLIVVALIAIYNFAPEKVNKPYEIQNVTRVFVHGTGNNYSVMTEDPISKKIWHYSLPLCDNKCTIELIADVPDGKSMWVDVKIKENRPNYIIHVRSAEDCEGGMRRGKHPKQTNVVR